MMKVLLSVLVIMLLICACQCNRNPTKPQIPLLGRYEFTAHDNSGRLAFTGSMFLLSVESNHVKGECTIVKEANAPEGFIEQDGPCEALIEGTTLNFDLAPNMDDAGVLLEGELDHGQITGIWKIDGFATSPPLGRFEALKKEIVVHAR